MESSTLKIVQTIAENDSGAERRWTTEIYFWSNGNIQTHRIWECEKHYDSMVNAMFGERGMLCLFGSLTFFLLFVWDTHTHARTKPYFCDGCFDVFTMIFIVKPVNFNRLLQHRIIGLHKFNGFAFAMNM